MRLPPHTKFLEYKYCASKAGAAGDSTLYPVQHTQTESLSSHQFFTKGSTYLYFHSMGTTNTNEETYTGTTNTYLLCKHPTI